ncbi:MAG: energy transducer TonB [Bacteroidia bacterium]|nr:energy transducer TonB [Bacteroidia bacterium]
MKLSIKIITVLLFLSASVFAQKDKKGKGKEKVEEKIYATVDQKAVYAEGENAMKDLIKKNATVPASMKESKTVLKSNVKLTIDETGKVTDAVTDGASACGDCDKEAVRVAKMLGTFTPAKLKGKNVKSYLTINVEFLKLPAAEDSGEGSTSRKKKMVWGD